MAKDNIAVYIDGNLHIKEATEEYVERLVIALIDASGDSGIEITHGNTVTKFRRAPGEQTSRVQKNDQ